MSKLSEKLRGMRIFNNYELLAKFGDDYDRVVEYCPPIPRSPRARMSVVWTPVQNLRLEFIGARDESLPKAIRWAEAKFGRKMVPSPFGGYVTERVRKLAEQAVS